MTQYLYSKSESLKPLQGWFEGGRFATRNLNHFCHID